MVMYEVYEVFFFFNGFDYLNITASLQVPARENISKRNFVEEMRAWRHSSDLMGAPLRHIA